MSWRRRRKPQCSVLEALINIPIKFTAQAIFLRRKLVEYSVGTRMKGSEEHKYIRLEDNWKVQRRLGLLGEAYSSAAESEPPCEVTELNLLLKS